MKVTIDMIRHGEPVGGKKYRGHLDDPLSEKGWRQMREAVGDHSPWQVIVSSPLARCSAFAEEMAGRHALPLEIDPRFKEIGFGRWEGRTAAELLERDPENLSRFWNDPMNNTPPGAESLPAFRDRVVPAWLELLERQAGKHVLLVAHAGVMRMVLCHALGMPLDHLFRIQVENGCITRLDMDAHGDAHLPRLIFHGGRL
jgi:alpha-ribazole phosphatase/probable phosphoglycerate mutase